MYYMLECLSPEVGFNAMVSHRDADPRRCWIDGERFHLPPPLPLRPTLRMRQGSVLAELWKSPLPLMSQRLYQVLLACGVDNLDVYPVELLDPKSGQTYTDYVAFNLIGPIAAADLSKSIYSIPDDSAAASDGAVRAADFDSLAIDESKARGALMFRLAESLNGIVVHESVKQAIEDSGIHTLTFIPPEKWVG